MVGPNMDCLDPAVNYVDKNVENELVDGTKSVILLCLLSKRLLVHSLKINLLC